MKITDLTSSDIKTLGETYSTELQAALTGRANMESNWLDWIRAYRAKPRTAKKSTPWDDASNLVIGLSAIYVDSIVARVMQGIFSIEPHWTASELNRKSAKGVKPVERYLDWARQHVWNQRKVVKSAVLESCKLGTGIITNGWRDEKYMVFDDASGETKKEGRWVGPDPKWVPRNDFLLAPGFTCPQSSPWVAYRQWFSWQQLQCLDYAGAIENLEELKGKSDESNEVREAYVADGTLSRPLAEDKFGMWSPWQVWFREDLDQDGYPEEYIMMLHCKSKAVLRIRANPYLGGLRMFVAWPFVELEGQFDGMGVPEMIEHYQEEVTTGHNQRVDNGSLVNNKMAIVRKGCGITGKEKSRPGKFLFVQDPKSDVVPFSLGEVNPSSFQSEQLTIGLAERRIGINDVNMGNPTPPVGRATATTVMALMQEGTRRFDLSTSELREALTEQGIQILELYQTHGLPEANDAGSPEQVLDEDDAQMVRGMIMAQDWVRGAISLNLNVATAAVNKEVEKQSTLQLLGVVTQYFQGVQATLMQIGPMIASPQADPRIKALFIKMMEGVDTMMQRVFQAHQTYDLDSILLGDLLQQMAGGPNGQQGVGPGMAPNAPQGFGGDPNAADAGAYGVGGNNGGGY